MSDEDEATSRTALQPFSIDLTPLNQFQDQIEGLSKYEGLAIAGVDDTEGYDLVKIGQRHCAKVRGLLEKERKRLKDPIIQVGRAIEELANEAKAEIAEIEGPLKASLKAIDDENARIEEERQAAEQRRLAERVDALRAAGADWSPIAVAEMTDDDYDQALTMAQDAQKQRQEAEERAERERVAEEERKAAELAEAKADARRVREELEAAQRKRDQEEAERAEAKRIEDAERQAEKDELAELRREKELRDNPPEPAPIKETPTSPDVGASGEPVDPSAGSGGNAASCVDVDATAAADRAQAVVFALAKLSKALRAAVDAWPDALEPSRFADEVSIAVAEIETDIDQTISALILSHGGVRT